jgi:hypothetical protein
MRNTDTNNQSELNHTVEVDIGGFKCLQFFDRETEELCLLGPKESVKAQKRYRRKYGALCRNKYVIEQLTSISPEIDLSVKINAFLYLVEEHKRERRKGNAIDSERVSELVDTWVRQPPLDFVAWCLATRSKAR